MLKLERPWTKQPQGVVDLSARIPAPVAAIFPWRGSLIEQQQKQAITFVGTDAFGVGPGGRAIRHLNSASAYSTIPHHPKYAVTGDVTVLAVVTSLAFSAEQAVLLKGNGARTAFNQNIPLFFSISTSGSLNIGRAGGAVQSYSSSTTTGMLAAGKPQVIGVTAPAGGTGDSVALARFYANGVSSGATAGYSDGNAAVTDAGDPLYIGRWTEEGGLYQYPRNGDTYAILLFDRVLPESLMRALTASPEAFYSLALAPRRIFIPTAAAAGGAYTLTADSGTFTNTGGAASFVFTRKLAADSGTFAYTGGDAGLAFNRKLISESGTFSYSGGDATFTYSGAGAPTYTLTSDSGTFSYSGGDAGLAFNRSLAADSGTFAYTGGDANFTRARTVAADGGTFAYSGGDATFLRTYVLGAESGTFTLNGGDATLTYSGAPVVVTAPQTGGGKARKQRKRQIQVEIDGEVINVESEAEAEEVLAKAAEQATETAKLAIERAAKAKRRPVRKIVRDAEKALSVPEISVPPSLQSYADQMIGRIRAEYQSALSAIEIAAHMARREREIEDDDEEVLMLL